MCLENLGYSSLKDQNVLVLTHGSLFNLSRVNAIFFCASPLVKKNLRFQNKISKNVEIQLSSTNRNTKNCIYAANKAAPQNDIWAHAHEHPRCGKKPFACGVFAHEVTLSLER